MKKWLESLFFIALKMLLGCFLGLFFFLFYASRSEIVKQEIKNYVQQAFKNDFDCVWQGQVSYVDLLTLQIEFSDVTMAPVNSQESWSFFAQKFLMSASWYELIFHKQIVCHGYFDAVLVQEKYVENSSYFMQLLSKMFLSSSAGNMYFQYIAVKNGECYLQDSTGDLQTFYRYNCQMSCEADGMHTKVYFVDGDCQYKNETIFNGLYGNFVLTMPYNSDLQEIFSRVDCRLKIPLLQEEQDCFLVGDVFKGRGAFVLSNQNQSFIVEPLKFKLKQDKIPVVCSVNIDLDLLERCIRKEVIISDFSGQLSMTTQFDLYNIFQTLHGSLEIISCGYKHNHCFDKILVDVQNNDDGYDISFFGKTEKYGSIRCIKNAKGYQFFGDFEQEIPLWLSRYWKIPAQKNMVQGDIFTDNLSCLSQFHIGLDSVKLDEKNMIEGSFFIDTSRCDLTGTFLDRTYFCSLIFAPDIFLEKFICLAGGDRLIDFQQDPTQGKDLVGFLTFDFIKKLLPDMYKSSFSQNGAFEMKGNLNAGLYQAMITSHDAHIRIPSLYNVVQDFSAQIQVDFITRSIVLDAMVIRLYEGLISCDHAVSFFNGQGSLTFLHIPFYLENVLVHWSKGIFGVVFGKLFLLQQEHEKPIMQGNLILDQAQLKGNIFSAEFQKQLLGSVSTSQDADLQCDVDLYLETKEPVVIETAFLQAAAHFDLHLTGAWHQPEIEGSINLVSGELKFPYKSLFITHGHVQMMPKNQAEPSIEFVAKARVKRYDITMRAFGTVSDQQIHFESSPYLTEEQIMSLLLVGSHDSSLSVIMPAVLMQKFHEIVFGPAMSQSKLDLFFDKLLQSFKNVRVFPQFTNQAGRGGIRGIVEVDATERLHGRIDSNLMQLEDTSFEVDYLVTDDVTLRMMKDGPSTYGGEIEARWKFS
jgi:hypothetical protein